MNNDKKTIVTIGRKKYLVWMNSELKTKEKELYLTCAMVLGMVVIVSMCKDSMVVDNYAVILFSVVMAVHVIWRYIAVKKAQRYYAKEHFFKRINIHDGENVSVFASDIIPFGRDSLIVINKNGIYLCQIDSSVVGSLTKHIWAIVHAKINSERIEQHMAYRGVDVNVNAVVVDVCRKYRPTVYENGPIVAYADYCCEYINTPTEKTLSNNMMENIVRIFAVSEPNEVNFNKHN